jgi:DsbC/DsbD-like thiol-disulfide interchange protein
MKRRHLLHLPLLCLFSTRSKAAAPPWSLKLLQGGFDGTAWNGGIAIALDDNWKTYWRVPGDGGIAPSFQLKGDNIKSSRIDYPTPQRFKDEAGTTIGYKNQVVFPFVIEPIDENKPVALLFEAFFGVCDAVCIPAQVSQALRFDPAHANAPDQAVITEWRKQLPVLKPQGIAEPAQEPVAKATAIDEADTVVLKLELNEAVTDVFVEGDAKYYFGTPVLTEASALIRVNGAKQAAELKAAKLRITLVLKNAALEQMITVL